MRAGCGMATRTGDGGNRGWGGWEGEAERLGRCSKSSRLGPEGDVLSAGSPQGFVPWGWIPFGSAPSASGSGLLLQSHSRPIQG